MHFHFHLFFQDKDRQKEKLRFCARTYEQRRNTKRCITLRHKHLQACVCTCAQVVQRNETSASVRWLLVRMLAGEFSCLPACTSRQGSMHIFAFCQNIGENMNLMSTIASNIFCIDSCYDFGFDVACCHHNVVGNVCFHCFLLLMQYFVEFLFGP